MVEKVYAGEEVEEVEEEVDSEWKSELVIIAESPDTSSSFLGSGFKMKDKEGS